MKRQVVKELIAEGKSLQVALEAVGMAMSSYHYQPVRKGRMQALDEALVKAINKVCQGLRLQEGHCGVEGFRVDSQR